MPRLNSDERNQAISMLAAGQMVLVVAGKTKRKLATRVRPTGSVRERPSSGRPRVAMAGPVNYVDESSS